MDMKKTHPCGCVSFIPESQEGEMMKKVMGIDMETYSSAPLPKCGVYRSCGKQV